MRARDVIVIARRRAGLSQQALAERLEKPQSTVGRWESGAREPGFADVMEAVRACDLQLTLGMASADSSWASNIYDELLRSPVERVRHLGGTGRLAALRDLAGSDARAIVVGDTAGALHGWPLLLGSDERVDVVAHAVDTPALLADPRLRLLDAPAGSWGYGDLARSVQPVEIDDVGTVHVAALVDLLRLAMADTSLHAQTWALALDATLQQTARFASGVPQPVELTAQQAEQEIAAWLSTRR